MQVIGTVVAMQSFRHDKHYAISGIAAHPCKKRKDGAPAFSLWEKKNGASGRVGHPPKLDKLNKAINRENDRMKKSETHSRKEKGQQQ